MPSGGFADRYGYKRTLFFSITMNIIGYLMMAFLHSYYGLFGGIIVLAIGTAFFKPSLQATIAHNPAFGAQGLILYADARIWHDNDQEARQRCRATFIWEMSD